VRFRISYARKLLYISNKLSDLRIAIAFLVFVIVMLLFLRGCVSLVTDLRHFLRDMEGHSCNTVSSRCTLQSLIQAGLWLIWKQDFDITVVDHSHNYTFSLCNNLVDCKQFGLVCLYGDPHHQNTAVIWGQVLNFVVSNSNLPILCMGDLNDNNASV
jgi:hypothetical protein